MDPLGKAPRVGKIVIPSEEPLSQKGSHKLEAPGPKRSPIPNATYHNFSS